MKLVGDVLLYVLAAIGSTCTLRFFVLRTEAWHRRRRSLFICLGCRQWAEVVDHRFRCGACTSRAARR